MSMLSIWGGAGIVIVSDIAVVVIAVVASRDVFVVFVFLLYSSNSLRVPSHRYSAVAIMTTPAHAYSRLQGKP